MNHFLYSTELTRKDKLVLNFMKMRNQFGPYEFNFLPESYVLPDEMSEFKQAFEANQHLVRSKTQSERKNKEAQVDNDGHYADNVWIIKPAHSSRGRGIFLMSDLNDLPNFQQSSSKDDVFVVSKYISNPLLINGFKFDLRIYVLVTSTDPLKIYIYNEGLVRFASEPYKQGKKNSKYSHLTNYSINKKNENFV